MIGRVFNNVKLENGDACTIITSTISSL